MPPFVPAGTSSSLPPAVWVLRDGQRLFMYEQDMEEGDVLADGPQPVPAEPTAKPQGGRVVAPPSETEDDDDDEAPTPTTTTTTTAPPAPAPNAELASLTVAQLAAKAVELGKVVPKGARKADLLKLLES